jgi:hypothetical protein
LSTCSTVTIVVQSDEVADEGDLWTLYIGRDVSGPGPDSASRGTETFAASSIRPTLIEAMVDAGVIGGVAFAIAVVPLVAAVVVAVVRLRASTARNARNDKGRDA